MAYQYHQHFTCKRFRFAFKKIIASFVVLSLCIPQFAFSNPDGFGDINDDNINKIKRDALDFQKLTPEELIKNGIDPSTIFTTNTAGEVNGQQVELDLIRGEFSADKSENILKIFKLLEPQLILAVKKDPNTIFKIISITEDGPQASREVEATSAELLSYIQNFTAKADSLEEKIPLKVAERLKNSLNSIFDKTSNSDVFWSFLRLVFNGSSASYSFYVSGVPVPISILLGGAVMGSASASIGLLIEKFTGWLEHNEKNPNPTPREKIKSKIFSPETLMITAPLLIGLQDSGLNSPETLAVLGTSAAITVLVQNVYRVIKNRFPGFGMWYKWYATEALFLTLPYLLLPAWDLYSKNTFEAVTGVFMFSLLSTFSQGIWDIVFTKIRSPGLKAAKEKDIAELAQRLADKNLADMTRQEIRRDIYRNEFLVREKFKKYFFAGSVWSVTSAVLGSLGKANANSDLQTAGLVGLGFLALAGGGVWISYKFGTLIKNKSTRFCGAIRVALDKIRPYHRNKVPIGASCNMLFSPHINIFM